MRVTEMIFTPVSVPYTHRERSFQVNRDGVTEVVVEIWTDNGLVGWGESCSGADVFSIVSALEALRPIVVGRDPWNRDAILHDCFQQGIWNFRQGTFNFAFAGIDMALWDLCGKECGQPLYRLLGGLRRTSVEYFWYLSYGPPDETRRECAEGVKRGYSTFYIKVGIDLEQEMETVAAIRETIGSSGRIRIDANQAWTVAQACRNLALFDRWQIDFAEQPVPANPIENMCELRRKSVVPVAANEGLWTYADAWAVVQSRSCDVVCFSPYWVGSIESFRIISIGASANGILTCKHTHGELGIAATACQHCLLSLPRIVVGHQQTATLVQDDVLVDAIPIAASPVWGIPEGSGIGATVSREKLNTYADLFKRRGQYLPYDPRTFAIEDPNWHQNP